MKTDLFQLWPLLSFPDFLAYWEQYFHSIIFQDLKQLNWNFITCTSFVHSDASPYCQIQTYIEESRENLKIIQVWPKSIPYAYIVEMTNRFKGLDLIDRVPEELWTEVHDIVQESVIKTIPNKKKCKKANRLSEEAL